MRFGKFVLTNLSGTVVDTAVLLALSAVLTSPAALYLLAPVIAFELATLNNFTLAYNWVWRERVEPSWKDFWTRFVKFNVSVLGVFLMRLGLIAALGFSLGLPVVVCNLIALTLSGLVNFGAADRLVFGGEAPVRPRPVRPTPVPVQIVPW